MKGGRTFQYSWNCCLEIVLLYQLLCCSTSEHELLWSRPAEKAVAVSTVHTCVLLEWGFCGLLSVWFDFIEYGPQETSQMLPNSFVLHNQLSASYFRFPSGQELAAVKLQQNTSCVSSRVVGMSFLGNQLCHFDETWKKNKHVKLLLCDVCRLLKVLNFWTMLQILHDVFWKSVMVDEENKKKVKEPLTPSNEKESYWLTVTLHFPTPSSLVSTFSVSMCEVKCFVWYLNFLL